MESSLFDRGRVQAGGAELFMNELNSLNQQYQQKKIAKAEYIQKMHGLHARLFEYSHLMTQTNISKIEISDQGVIMTSRAEGIRILCDPSDYRIAPIEILNFEEYEKQDSDCMIALLQNCRTLLDIGANFGWYSLIFAKKFSTLQVHSFEPIPETYQYLKKNIGLNSSIQNIQTWNFGFSTENTEAVFYFYPEGSVNASLANVSGNKQAQEVRCQIKKLDDFIQTENLCPDFIKCDVEGAEFRVFQGGVETLKQNLPIVFSELLRKWSAPFGYHPNDVLNFFRELGYECFVSCGHQKFKKFTLMDDQTLETNFFFLHKKKHSELIEKYVQ